MILLPNGCYCSGTKGDPKKGKPDSLSVYPKNWNTKKAPLNVIWYIHYRFYDPAIKEGKFSTGKQIVRKGLNAFTSLEERQQWVYNNLAAELSLLQVDGFNPITGQCIEKVVNEFEIDPTTPFSDALDKAVKRLSGVKGTLDDARSVVSYVKIGLSELRYEEMPIETVRTKHLTVLLDYMQANNIAPQPKEGKPKHPFTSAKYNRYRANLVMIFKKLKQLGAVEANYVEDVERKKKVIRIRLTLTEAERIIVNNHLQVVHPPFHRFMHIFYHSGARETEIMALKGKDVNLGDQTFRVIIKKGTEYREVDKIIVDSAMALWKAALVNCGPEDYVFAEGFVPGMVPINPNVICRWWLKLVKKPLGIKADFYPLKHLNTTAIVELLSNQEAAEINSHTSTEMVDLVYDVRQKIRKDDKLKRVSNTFV